ncbi:50S ribosomal protein L32e [Methanobacterium aggregans]|uniref:50S ribosomal protein L32e n=1 Tax=Methanobacterium aggregans TaxID=1615586 RepID=UPI001AE9716E|nr:50S ribosomal protein L32e [Methanobacterium aggregans]MBP2044912.1 large subunit ribosomal protein L32e [Methanobacterium aggregans]
MKKTPIKKPKKPNFKRQEWFRYKKLGDKYRKPKGKTSKRRRYEARKPAMAAIGYRTPRTIRGLHPSGYQDVLVCNMAELEQIDPENQAGRISSKIGKRKKEIMLERAKELGIKILNKGL